MSATKSRKVVLVGATGLVGSAIIQTLERFPIDPEPLVLMATKKSADRKVRFRGTEMRVEEFDPSAFDDAWVVFFSGKDGLSEKYCPIAAGKGAWVIDNSAVFRMADGVPLVVPEVNPHEIGPAPRLIANPNCSTVQLAVVLNPIRKNFGLKRVIVSTYQSASGAGSEYLAQLNRDTAESLEKGFGGLDASSLAFNCLPDVGSQDIDGKFSEEVKLENELRKILGMPDLPVCATAVRVPTQVGHGESVVIETEKPADPDEVRSLLGESDGIAVEDEFEAREFPTPRKATGMDDVYVGRIRRAGIFENDLAFWVVADNLLKGAALNAVQIALYIREREKAALVHE
jgi:aspartate-semialdehyde dehydrogenase